MPANLPTEWYLIEEEYRNAKTKEEKIEKLKRLIAATPKHKGTEKLRARLKKQLAKLRKQTEKKGKRKVKAFRKVGDILVAIVGKTNSGKSTLLHELTGASVEISSKPYTTKELATGVCYWKGVGLQLVEIPSFFLPRHLSVAKQADVVIILAGSPKELEELKENGVESKQVVLRKLFFSDSLVGVKVERDYSQLLNGIIELAGVVRVFTKPPGKPVEKKAVVFHGQPKVEDVIKRIDKRWLERFKFARVYRGKEMKRVGLEYKLEDGDVLEIHAS